MRACGMWIVLLPMVSMVHAEDIWFKRGEVPVWNQSIYSTYKVKLTDTAEPVIGTMGLDDGYEGKYAGLIGFDIFDSAELKRLKGHWRELTPEIYKQRTRVWLDGKLYFEDVTHDVSTYLLGKYLIGFPYPVKSFHTEIKLSTDKTYRMGIGIPGIPNTKLGYDLRRHPDAPKSDWNRMKLSAGSVLVRHCISSPQHGPIKKLRAILHKHPLFAPKSDILLAETTVQMPVYEIYLQQGWGIEWLIPRERRLSEDYKYTVTGECETADGSIFRTTKTITIYHWPPSAYSGHSDHRFWFYSIT